MKDQSHYFGASAATNLSPVGIAALIVAALLILTVNRKYLVHVFLMSAIIIPGSQHLVVATFNLQALRLVIIATVVRLLFSKMAAPQNWFRLPFTAIDKFFLCWIISNCVMFSLLWGDPEAVTNRLGFAFTCLGPYFILKMLIRDEEDINRAIQALAMVAFVCACFMTLEQLTGRNLVNDLMGMPSAVGMRDGRIRSQASFAHPLLAGSFGAVLIPLFIGLLRKPDGNRLWAKIGIVSGFVMAIASMSSTAVLGIAAGLGGLWLWRVRRSLAAIRWAIVGVLIALNLAMKAPVWALIARINLTGGSSGYHRYQLIDQAIRRFSEWWLFGTKYQSTWGWDMWDSINWYVNEGTTGGVLTMLLFIGVLVVAFRKIGIARAAADEAGDTSGELFIWALGATLFANAVSFFGISYFDQSFVMWCATLVIISTATFPLPIDEEEVPAEDSIEYPERELADA